MVPLDDVIPPARRRLQPGRCSPAQTVEGKVYGIPMIQDMQMLFYRKSLLRRPA